MKHTISVLVENKPGVLARVAGLFSARGYNIASLAVSETLDPAFSYLTMVVDAQHQEILEQIKKQLNKLIDVIKVTDLTKKEHVERELLLIKIKYSPAEKNSIQNLLNKYAAKIIQHKASFAIIEMVGEEERIRELLNALQEIGIIELIRTGKIAIGI